MAFTMAVSECLALVVMALATWCVSGVVEGKSEGVNVLESEGDGTCHWLNG